PVTLPFKLTRFRSCSRAHCFKQASAWSFRGTLLQFSGRRLGKLLSLAGLAMVVSAFSALASTPNFVQGNSAVPQSAQTQVSVVYSAAQSVGDLNVVAVGWN